MIEELGNPFEEESMDLVVLDMKEMADLAAIESHRNVKRIDQENFQIFFTKKNALWKEPSLFMIPFIETS